MSWCRFVKPIKVTDASAPVPPPPASASATQQPATQQPGGPPAKKQRRVKSTAGKSPASVIIPGPTATTMPSAGPANLWAHGLTPELRASLEPPSRYADLGGLTPDMMAEIEKMQETAYKAASLLSALHSAGEKINTQVATIASLNDRVAQLEKEAKDLGEAKCKVDGSLTAARDQLKVAQAAFDKLKESFDNLSKERDETVGRLQADLDLASNSVSEAAYGSWDNCVAQAQLLNPGLITEGMSLFCEVRDGQIVNRLEVGVTGDGADVSSSMLNEENLVAEGAETSALNPGDEVVAPNV